MYKIMNITTGEYVATWDGSKAQLEKYDDEKYLLVDTSKDNEVVDPKELWSQQAHYAEVYGSPH